MVGTLLFARDKHQQKGNPPYILSWGDHSIIFPRSLKLVDIAFLFVRQHLEDQIIANLQQAGLFTSAKKLITALA